MKLVNCFIPLTAYVQSIKPDAGHDPESLTSILDAKIDQARIQALQEGIELSKFQEALFPVLAWADEKISRSNTLQQGHAWQRHLLQRRYFKTGLAGQEFFERLEQIEPADILLREIYLYCLCLGFQGRYSLASNATDLTNIRIEQYRLLKQHDKSRATHGVEFFPDAYGQVSKPKKRNLFGSWSWQRILFIVLPPIILVAIGLSMHTGLTYAVRNFREAINL